MKGFVLEDDKIGAVSYHGRAHCFQQKGMYNRAIEGLRFCLSHSTNVPSFT